MATAKQKNDVAELLQGAGLRSTRQRLALGSLLFDGMHKHVTAEQVFDAARKSRVRVSLATVYNTLHQFTGAGLLREVVIDASRVYFDTNTDNHHHFFDETEGRLTDVPASSVHVDRLPKLPAGSRLTSVDVVIRVRRK
jgi:Fur family transcriptional regulator, iron response regulator